MQRAAPMQGRARGADRRVTAALKAVRTPDAIWHAKVRLRVRRIRLWGYGLTVGAVLLPALLFAAVAWQDYTAVLRHTQRDVGNTVRVLEEHARNLFETHKLVATLINDHIAGLSWQQIAESDELHRFLAGIAREYPQIQSLWLADPTGRVRNSSAVFPAPPVSVEDRDYFVALRERDWGLFIGRPVHGRVFVEDIFNVAQRRVSDTGAFDGVVVVSALPSQFINFWTTIGIQAEDSALLIRGDGSLLARKPATAVDTPPLAPTSNFMRAIANGDAGAWRAHSPFDRRERFFAYHKINGFPVYVGLGVDVSGALRLWHEHLLVYGGFFALAVLGLVALAVTAVVHANREATALRHWRDTAQQLAEEAERRAVIEGQLRQAQKMEVLGQIAGGMAHDFGNILQLITGYLELLRPCVAPSESNLVTKMSDAIETARKAVRALLTFARRQPSSPTSFDLHAALAGIEDMLRQAVTAQIRLELAPASGCCLVTADRNQLELAVLNIVLNARDAMPAGGTLSVTTTEMWLVGEPNGLVGRFAALAIKDSGTGMPPAVAARVFEPFFTTKAAGQGTGLGMSMVYGFASQSNGCATIDSVMGRGTTITLYLPMAGSKF